MSQRTDPNPTPIILRRISAAAKAGSIDTEGVRAKTPATVYGELRRKGFAAAEAGNLTAYLNGLRPVEGGWSPREIESLLFMRHLVARGWDDAHAPA
jgi:hypothetical protein